MIILSRLFFSTARRTNQEAPPQLSGFGVCRRSRRRGLRNSLRSDSPRPFSSVFLTTSPTDKGGDFARAFASLFNPLALRALPLYSFQEHRGRGGLPLLSPLRVFLTPPSLRTPPLYFAAQNTEEEGESNPPLVAVRYPAYGVRQGRIVIQRTFFPCQRKSLLH